MDLNKVVQNFLPDKETSSIKPFGNGHINSTFKVVLSNSTEYILQKINTSVFLQPEDLVHNHKLLQDSFGEELIDIPQLVGSTSGQFLFTDEEKNTWRMTNFIENSYSVEVVENDKQAFEAGKGFGWFLKYCSKFNSSNFFETIKNFHSIQFRYKQLSEAVQKDSVNRVEEGSEIINFYKDMEDELKEVEKLVENKEIPKRVVHNDTKINNLLFRKEKAVAVIDLDTVGPGSVIFDYGDAIRTISNTSAEDEKDLSMIQFNSNAFEHFTQAYLEQCKDILTQKEKEILYIAPVYMTAIMGIRFLTDYLNGDMYYKTNYKQHNLVRSIVQKTLIEKMELEKDFIQNIIQKYSN